MKSWRIWKRLFFGLLVSAMIEEPTVMAGGAGEQWVYFGTYTKKESKGIYVSRLNCVTGELSAPELAAETSNPSFLAVHPSGSFLYSVGEGNSGEVKAFRIDAKTGKLQFLNQQSSGGSGPCHLTVDASGRSVLVANYGGGNASVLPLKNNGELGQSSAFVQHTGSSINPRRQKQPHAHSITLDPSNRYAFVADLGIDKIMIYQFDASLGRLTTNEPASVSVKPGAGPRHFTFHPNGRFAYVINEMSCTITAFEYDNTKGSLKEIESISTLPQGVEVEAGFSTAEIQVHPTGKFLFGSNRGHDSISVFFVDEKTGKIKLVQNAPSGGKIPRNFGIDPKGHFLLVANQESDNVVTFRIDPKTGRLNPTGKDIRVQTPVCVKFVKQSK